MAEDGPLGYGKRGSLRGSAAAEVLAAWRRQWQKEHLQAGKTTLYCRSLDDLPSVTAQKVGEAAQQGDEPALRVFAVVAEYLGRGLAVLIDILNPEKIVIGSIYLRQKQLLEPIMLQTLRTEALAQSLAVCEIVLRGLGELVVITPAYRWLSTAYARDRGLPGAARSA